MSKETTHIRIEKELKQLLEQQAGQDETINDVIRRLLTDINKAVNLDVNPNVNCDVNTLQDAIQALTARVERLEQDRQIQHKVTLVADQQENTQPSHVDEISVHEVYTIPSDESIPGHHENTLASHVGGLSADRVDIEAGIPDSQVQPSHVNEMPVTKPGIPNNQERVDINDEIRQELISHVDKLQAAGMSYQVIADQLGIGKGRISDLKSGKLKTLTRPQYDTLMRLP